MSQSNDNQWDKNFKIPKRKLDEATSSDNASFTYNSGNSLAENSYYEYYNQYAQAQWQQSTAYPQQYYASQSGSTNSVEPITQNIYKTLSSIKEKPKNYKRDIFRDTVPDINDSTLPKELTSQFQPLFCKLCTAQLSSNVMAKLHYKSKNHEKKVRKFLIEHAEKTGTPLHKRAKLTAIPKDDEETDPRWFHCDVCDLPLTGKMHAESHYMGKNHHKVIMGYKMPAGRGYYNDEGKWVRSGPSKKLELKDGEDTFGQDFRKDKIEIGVAAIPASVAQSQTQSKFHCSICNVGTTCQEQLDIHFHGQKHKKKLRQLGIYDDSAGPQSTQRESAPDQVVTDMNLSVYRTPSGDYYCPSCNLTLSSGIQFRLHIKGKQHIKKSSMKPS
ncbi:zinc finger matrin-type protein 4 isoform X2 [Diorhabda carinulata]|uniref:zinc finger matrin-type protein 4 isoform X2 n=1 Tax=Diorhabda carinulata TaxID=1163345 RepID=UPI0025A2FB2B|nr:zinc finger matrin-type protein 4 isoform X2 [Diorhabda carinulata]